jgi:hypothetical protein
MSHVDLRHAVELYQSEAVIERAGAPPLARIPEDVRRLVARGYSKFQEVEADAQGLRLCSQAGYDPEAGARLYRRFRPASPRTAAVNPLDEAAGAARDQLTSYFDTHPPDAERIRRLEELARRDRRRLAGRPLYEGIENYRRQIPKSAQQFPDELGKGWLHAPPSRVRDDDSRETVLLASLEPHRQKLRNDGHVRPRVRVDPLGRERTRSGQPEREQQLIGQMLAGGCSRDQVFPRVARGRRRHLPSADANLAERGEDLRDFRASDLNHHRVAGAGRVAGLIDLSAVLAPVEHARRRFDLSHSDVPRKIGDDSGNGARDDFAALSQVQGLERGTGLDLGAKTAAAHCPKLPKGMAGQFGQGHVLQRMSKLARIG